MDDEVKNIAPQPTIDFWDDCKSETICQNCNGTGEVTVIDTRRLGKLLQKLRKNAKLKLHDISNEMRLSVGYVSDLEHARKTITHRLFLKYLFALEDIELRLEKQSLENAIAVDKIHLPVKTRQSSFGSG